MSAVLVSKKRQWECGMEDDSVFAKRLKCPPSPMLAEKHMACSSYSSRDDRQRIARMFPQVSSEIIASVLAGLGPADGIDQAVEALQRCTDVIGEDKAAMEEGSDAPLGSPALAPMGRKRAFEEVQHAAGSLSGGGRLEDWAERLVRSLHGCPSVDEAKSRAREAFAAFEEERNVARGDEKANRLQKANQTFIRVIARMQKEASQQRANLEEAGHANTALQESLARTEQMNRTLHWHLREDSRPGFNTPGLPGVF